MKILKTGLMCLLISFIHKANTLTKSKKNLKNLFTGEIDLPSKQIRRVNEPLLAEHADSQNNGFLQLKAEREYVTNNGDIFYTSPRYQTVKRDSLVPQIKLNLVINIENGDGDCSSDKEPKPPGKGKGKGKAKPAGISSTGFPNGKIRVFLDGEDIKEMSKKALKEKVTSSGDDKGKSPGANKNPKNGHSSPNDNMDYGNHEENIIKKSQEDQRESQPEVIGKSEKPSNSVNLPINPTSPKAPAPAPAAAPVENPSSNQPPRDWAAYFQDYNSRFERSGSA